MNYNPPRFMWLAEFDNGDCISQFDPDTGKENFWKNINVDRITKLSWITITPELSQKILETEGIYTYPNIISEIYSVEYTDDETPLIYRRNYIEYSGSIVVNRRTVYVLGRIKDGKKEIMYEVE